MFIESSKLEQLQKMLGECQCPVCGDRGYYPSYFEVYVECEWCFQRKQLVPSKWIHTHKDYDPAKKVTRVKEPNET